MAQTSPPLDNFPDNFRYNFLNFASDNLHDFFHGVLLDFSTKIVLASSSSAYLTSTFVLGFFSDFFLEFFLDRPGTNKPHYYKATFSNSVPSIEDSFHEVWYSVFLAPVVK